MTQLIDQSLTSAHLELAYERALRTAERIYEEERVRALRVQLLLAEDEADDLAEAEKLRQDELARSEDVVLDLETHIASLEQQYQSTQADLRTCMRDIEGYQAEVQALNTSNNKIEKYLSEKLALKREVARLKPELEDLRGQIEDRENVLVEKLALQRELRMVQAELDNEKKTADRLRKQKTIDASSNEEIEDLRRELEQKKKAATKLEKKVMEKKTQADAALLEQIERVRAELADAQKQVVQAQRTGVPQAEDSAVADLRAQLEKTQKAGQKAQREQAKKKAEWETTKDTLEEKLEQFRTKLRSTKEQLREAQDELERREQAKFAESAAATQARVTGQNPKKRSVARFDPDMTIGTPGNGAAMKKPKLNNVGDKSTFSITPFLNRTMSVLAESPAEAEMQKTVNEIATEARAASEQPKAKKPAGAALLEREKSKKGRPFKDTTTSANAKPKPLLATVSEDAEDQENQENQDRDQDVPVKSIEAVEQIAPVKLADITNIPKVRNASLQPKKMKVMRASSIFDDADGDATRRKVAGFSGLGKMSLGLGKNKSKVLAEFSPLKKDRKTVSAIPV